MGIELITGRAKSGKSHYILEKIEQIHLDNPAQNIYYLTPEQTTFSVEYKLSSSKILQGLGMIEVLSFERLAQKALAFYGSKSRIILDDLGKTMLLRKIIAEHKENLPHFRLALKQFGLLEAIAETLDELHRTCVDAETIAASLKNEQPERLISAKAQEIALIQTAYNQALLERASLDKSNLLNELTDLLKKETIFNRDIIIVDGFEYFTKQQTALLEQLSKQSAEIIIALCLDSRANDVFFAKQQKNYQEIQSFALNNQLIIKNVVTSYESYYLDPSLKFLEQHYTAGADRPYQNANISLKITECQNPKSEAELAAVIIRSLVREKKLRYNEIAVMAADIDNYKNYLHQALNFYEIPYFLDENSCIFTHPLTEMIGALFTINESNWSYQSVFAYLRSGLSCLELEEIDMLENYCLSAGIRGAQAWLSKRPWSWQGKRNEWGRDAVWDEAALFHLNDIRRRIVTMLNPLLKKLNRKQTVRELLGAIMEFLLQNQIPTQLAAWQNEALIVKNFTLAQIHGQIWETVCSIFDQMAEICGEEILELNETAQLLDSAFKNITLGKIPLGLDQIFIGSPKRSRLSSVKAVILLGANEGLIPAKAAAQGVFTLSELNVLRRWGWADTLEKIYDEEFSIYKTLSAAQEYLYLSYALADTQGKSQRRSSIIGRIEGLFAEMKVISEEDLLQKLYFEQKMSLSTALKIYQKGSSEPDFPKAAASLSWYRKFTPEQAENLEKMLNNPPSIKVSLRQYTDVLNLSVSAIEKYRACPYAYFLSYTLSLKERDIYTLDALNTGDFYHKALEELTDTLLEEGLDWGNVSDEHLDELIAKIVEQLLPQLKNEILLSQGRYRFIKDKLTETIRQSAHNLAKQSRRGAFKTLKSEFAFGYGNNEFTITLQDNTKICLRGRIDLIEQAQGRDCNYLRIIDFKSGANDLPLDEVYYGLKIQLLVYLKAALKSLPGYQGAGVLYRYIKNPFIKGSSKLSHEEAERLYLKEIKPKGLLLGHFEPLYLADGELLDNLSSDILPFKLKKDGKEYLQSHGLHPSEEKNINDLFDQNSAVVSQNQLDALQKHIECLIAETGQKILAGEFTPHPYKYKSKSGCNYCRYGSICRFNAAEKANYNKLPKISPSDIWQSIEEEE